MTRHKLFTKKILQQLRANYIKQQASPKDLDFKPVVKIFNPYGAATWLFTEFGYDGRLFGLCDLGFGFPELGYVNIYEILSTKIEIGESILPLERELFFYPEKTLSIYTKQSKEKGYIVD